jgi:hypothetical protein
MSWDVRGVLSLVLVVYEGSLILVRMMGRESWNLFARVWVARGSLIEVCFTHCCICLELVTAIVRPGI